MLKLLGAIVLLGFTVALASPHTRWVALGVWCPGPVLKVFSHPAAAQALRQQ